MRGLSIGFLVGLTTLVGHSQVVHHKPLKAIQLSSNDSLLVAGDQEGRLSIWSLHDQRLIDTVRSGDRFVTDLQVQVFLQGGVTVSNSTQFSDALEYSYPLTTGLNVWQKENGSYTINKGMNGGSILIDLDEESGRFYFAGNLFEQIKFKETLLTIAENTTPFQLHLPKKTTSLKVSPRGKLYALGYHDGTFDVFNSPENKVVYQGKLPAGFPAKMEFSHDEKSIFVLPCTKIQFGQRHYDKRILQFKLKEKGSIDFELPTDFGNVQDFDVSRSGSKLAAVSTKNSVVIWSIAKGTQIFSKPFYGVDKFYRSHAIQVVENEPLIYLAGEGLSSEGKMIAYNYNDGTYHSLGTPSGPKRKINPPFVVSLSGMRNFIPGSGMGARQKIFFSNSYDNVCLWDPGTGQLIKCYDSLTRKSVMDPNDLMAVDSTWSINNVDLDEEAGILAVAMRLGINGPVSKVKVISTKTDRLLAEIPFQEKALFPKPDLHVSSTGRYVVMGHRSEDNDVLVIDTKEKRIKPLAVMPGREVNTWISPDEKWLIVTEGGFLSADSRLLLFSIADFKLKLSLPVPKPAGYDFIGFSPDSKYALLNSKLVSLPDLREVWIRELEPAYSTIIGHKFDEAAGRLYLVLKGTDQKDYQLKTWDLRTSKDISSFSFSDSQQLEHCYWDLPARRIHLPYFDHLDFKVRTIAMDSADAKANVQIVTQTGHDDQVVSVGYSADQKYAYTYGYDKRAKVHDLKTSKEIFSLDGAQSPPAFDHTGRMVLVEKDFDFQWFDIATGRSVRRFDNATRAIPAHHKPHVALLSRPGAASLADDKLMIVDYEQNDTLYKYMCKPEESIGVVAFSPFMNELAIVTTLYKKEKSTITITLVDYQKGKILSDKILPGLEHAGSMWFLSPSELVITGGQGVVRFNILDGKILQGPNGNIVAIHAPSKTMALSDYSSIKFYSIENWKMTENFCADSIYNCHGIISSLAFSPDGKRLLTGQVDKAIEYDIRTKSELRKFLGKVGRVAGLSFDEPTSRLAIASTYKSPLIIDLSTGAAANQDFAKSTTPHAPSWISQFNGLINLRQDTLRFIGNKGVSGTSLFSGVITDKGYSEIDNVHEFKSSPDHRLLLIARLKNAFELVEAHSLKTLRTIKGNRPFCFSSQGKWIAWIDDNKVQLMDVVSGKMNKPVAMPYKSNAYNSIAVDDILQEVFVATSNSHAISFSLADSQKTRTWSSGEISEANIFLTADKKVVVAPGIYDLATHDKLGSIGGHTADITTVAESRKLLFTGSLDGTVKIWKKENSELVATLVVYDTAGFIIYTPDNYYFSSRNGTQGIAFKVGTEVYPFEQFDLSSNRPDIVLGRLGFANPKLIKAFHKAYVKRLGRAGLTEDNMKPDMMLPSTVITNQVPSSFVTDPIYQIGINASDPKYPLSKISVWVNNVPIYGSSGYRLAGNSLTLEKSLPVSLSAGKNKIQISATNSQGVESLRDLIEVNYKPVKAFKPDLYVITLSVSNYADTSHNLRYAVKDGRDIARLAQNRKNEFSHIYIDSLYDRRATLAEVKALKKKLLKSRPDDEVMIFVSGHGLLDEELNFYFGGYDIDFKDPKTRGIPYSAIESLLDSIPARNKLLLFDACHSGEVDKGQLKKVTSAVVTPGGKPDTQLKSTSFKGGPAAFQGLGLKTSIEWMQELFVDVQNRSGAIVISAAAGNSYALESPEWKNGVFTFVIKEALLEKKADANRDGIVSVSELQLYLSVRVPEETKGAQRPTSRQENQELNFRVY